MLLHPHSIAPIDVTVEKPDGHARVVKPGDLDEDDRMVDCGPDTVAMLAPVIANAKFILWNGPTGIYEQGTTPTRGSLPN